MSKISVLIAAYNVENYITEALNSVVAQTLKDIEIIVVDDCSTDNTFDIVSKYAELDSRIKVIKHEVNKGLMQVRQTGLRAARGEYVIFLDGDDALVPETCEKAYNAVVSEKVDMLQFGTKLYFVSASGNEKEITKDIRKAMHSVDHKVVSVSKAGVLDEQAVGDIINFTVWDKIYKRSLLEKAAEYIPNEYINMAEDVLYSFLIHYHARTYSYIKDELYVYRFGCGMSTTAKLSKRIIESIAKNAYVYNYLKNWSKSMDSCKECELALKRVHQKLYSHVMGTFFWRLDAEERAIFISEVLKYGAPDDVVLAMTDYASLINLDAETVANKCAVLDMFSSKKTKAKTIGVYYFRLYNGGVENVISSLSDMWIKSGYNVVLFTDEPPNKDDYYINPAVKRVVVPKMKERDFLNTKNRIEVFRQALIENDVDVMVYNAWASLDLVLDEMIIKSCGVNLVVHMHNLFCCETDNLNANVAYFYSVLPKLYAFADSVVAIADVDAAWWQLMGLRCFKTINPIQMGMDVEMAPLNGKNILYVGRIAEEKRVLDIIKIAELVQKKIPDVKLTVVGKGDDEKYIKSVDDYIAENELEGLVDMVGFKSNLLPYYQSADVMLSASRIEGCPLVLLEGKMCGVPLVSYEISNLDITRNAKGMVIVDQRDVEAAAEAVIEILENDQLKKKLGREARESIEEFYSIDLVQHWHSIFEQTLAPKPEPVKLYELPVNEAAVRIAVQHYSDGILRRIEETKRVIEMASTGRCAELERELERFKHSESYRIGMIVTFIPRVFIKLLKKILGRK